MDEKSGTHHWKSLGKWCGITPALVALAALIPLLSTTAQEAEYPAALQLETKIPLGKVGGRIDHMAVDTIHQRLFVAELGNDAVGVVDLKEGKILHTINGLAEPQGVGYVPSDGTVYVANGRDGSVRLFDSADYAPAGRIDLGGDADNVRFEAAADRILIGYGSGAIAAIDVKQRKKFGEVAPPGHPESFQIAPALNKVFVNVSGAGAIVVLDKATGGQTAMWPVREGGNFPMALDQANGRILIVSRNPPRLTARNADDGTVVATADTCGDSDDLFVDDIRGLVYVSCGAGFIDVFKTGVGGYRRTGRIPTMAGARTSLFVPELDRLYLAVRSSSAASAAIWVYRPAP